MSRLFHHSRGVLPRLAFVPVLIGGFSMGLLSARRAEARANGGAESSFPKISNKVWLSSQEVKNRFSGFPDQKFLHG